MVVFWNYVRDISGFFFPELYMRKNVSHIRKKQTIP